MPCKCGPNRFHGEERVVLERVVPSNPLEWFSLLTDLNIDVATERADAVQKAQDACKAPCPKTVAQGGTDYLCNVKRAYWSVKATPVSISFPVQNVGGRLVHKILVHAAVYRRAEIHCSGVTPPPITAPTPPNGAETEWDDHDPGWPTPEDW